MLNGSTVNYLPLLAVLPGFYGLGTLQAASVTINATALSSSTAVGILSSSESTIEGLSISFSFAGGELFSNSPTLQGEGLTFIAVEGALKSSLANLVGQGVLVGAATEIQIVEKPYIIAVSQDVRLEYIISIEATPKISVPSNSFSLKV